MASLDEFLAALFGSLGPVGSLLALLLIFAGDAALFPALPEAWIVVTYAYRPEVTDPLVWTALLLGTAVVGDVLGTTALYAVVRRVLVEGRRMPGWLERGMQRWTGFLLVRDERVILLNRLAPVVPFVGAFIATLRWNYRRSIADRAVDHPRARRRRRGPLVRGLVPRAEAGDGTEVLSGPLTGRAPAGTTSRASGPSRSTGGSRRRTP